MQRICDDVPAFTYGSTRLIMSAVRQLLNCIVFAGQCSLAQPVFILAAQNNAHCSGCLCMLIISLRHSRAAMERHPQACLVPVLLRWCWDLRDHISIWQAADAAALCHGAARGGLTF